MREQNRSEEDIQEIYRAYKFAEKLHAGQYRVSEEPYISLKETGLKLVEDGYFNIANNFPRKVTLSDLKDENLKEMKA